MKVSNGVGAGFGVADLLHVFAAILFMNDNLHGQITFLSLTTTTVTITADRRRSPAHSLPQTYLLFPLNSEDRTQTVPDISFLD